MSLVGDSARLNPVSLQQTDNDHSIWRSEMVNQTVTKA